MEIYANAHIASWQGATRLRSVNLAPIAAVADTTGVSVAAFGQPTFMPTHKSITRSGFPPRGRFR